MLGKKILSTISLGIELGAAVENVAGLVERKQPVTGDQVRSAVSGLLTDLENELDVKLPTQLLEEVCTTAATAMNRYVLGVQ